MVEVWSWVNGTNVHRGVSSPDKVCDDFFCGGFTSTRASSKSGFQGFPMYSGGCGPLADLFLR